jgi:hypothetical protein
MIYHAGIEFSLCLLFNEKGAQREGIYVGFGNDNGSVNNVRLHLHLINHTQNSIAATGDHFYGITEPSCSIHRPSCTFQAAAPIAIL